MINKIWPPIKNVLKKIRDFGYRNPITEYIVPIKNQVVLESAPPFSDNTYYIYLEMLKHNYQKKYKIIWLVTSDNINEIFKRNDISYFNINKKGLINKIKLNMLINSSKYIITCNRFYKRKTNRQIIIYLNHGQPLKDTRKLKMDFGSCNLSVHSSDFFLERNMQALNTSKEKFVVFQPPRNDGLLEHNIDAKKKMGYDGNKVIVWLPTFRNHMDGKRVDSSFKMPLGIPIIYNIKELEKLNNYLKKKHIIIVLKPHFVANLGDLKAKSYSNFKVIYNKDLDDFGITLYELLGSTDALITDYSSVYYDYLITKKPIGLTLDDYEDYKKETGFAYEYKEIMKGHYIYNTEDLYSFIDDLSNGLDPNKKDRLSIIKKLNFDTEGNYSKKLFDYIVKKYNF